MRHAGQRFSASLLANDLGERNTRLLVGIGENLRQSQSALEIVTGVLAIDASCLQHIPNHLHHSPRLSIVVAQDVPVALNHLVGDRFPVGDRGAEDFRESQLHRAPTRWGHVRQAALEIDLHIRLLGPLSLFHQHLGRRRSLVLLRLRQSRLHPGLGRLLPRLQIRGRPAQIGLLGCDALLKVLLNRCFVSGFLIAGVRNDILQCFLRV
mmetsp:Transcript_24622/g.59754  ORF Transcript_24622/g.59754 Transcript_24622/m.59754 type:complete len:209 (+) Transcript_24622:391-1017(+)